MTPSAFFALAEQTFRLRAEDDAVRLGHQRSAIDAKKELGGHASAAASRRAAADFYKGN